MEKMIMKEIMKKRKWYERVIIKIFKKLFIKIYCVSKVNMVNVIIID